MAEPPDLLACPMCSFAVLPSDSYVLELHFEQVHTTDSPFKIEDDPEPLPSSGILTPATSSKDKDAASDDDDGNWTQCPEPDCCEEVLLSELTEHLDFHAAERLNFDPEAANENQPGKMQTLTEESTPSFLEQNFSSELPDALRNHRHQSNKVRKRNRGNSSGSEKSTLSRSILSFNPFAFKANKIIKPPANSVRLGVSSSHHSASFTLLMLPPESRTWSTCVGR